MPIVWKSLDACTFFSVFEQRPDVFYVSPGMMRDFDVELTQAVVSTKSIVWGVVNGREACGWFASLAIAINELVSAQMTQFVS